MSKTSPELGRELARIRAAHRSPLKAVYAVASHMVDPDFHSRALEQSPAMRHELAAMLDQAVAEGELQQCDTARLARAVQAVMSGSLLQWGIDREGKVAERLSEDLDALLHPRHCPPHERRRVPRRKVSRV